MSTKPQPGSGGRRHTCQEGPSPFHPPRSSPSLTSGILSCLSVLFRFPQPPQLPQPTALPGPAPKPQPAEHTTGMKANSDADGRGGLSQKSSYVVSIFKQEGSISLGNNNHHKMPRNLGHFFALDGSSVFR